MSLEARIELLTAAVIELTAAIGGMQAPAEVKIYPNGHADGQIAKSAAKSAATEKATSSAPASTGDEGISPPANDDEALEQIEAEKSSSPELDYVKDVKPITLRLSKEKGREVTISVLQRFGVKGAQDLDKSQWADYIAHCEKVLAGGDV